MNQQPMGQMPMGNPQPAVSKWLWITLIIVILVGGGYFGWYYFMGPGKKVKTSTTVSTTAPASTTTNNTTTTPSTTTTATTDEQTTTTTTTTSTPPSGWKIDTNEVSTYRDVSAAAKYQIFIKNDWGGTQGDIAPAKVIRYGPSGCVASVDSSAPVISNCEFVVSLSNGQKDGWSEIEGIFYYNKKVTGCDCSVTIVFSNTISENDRKIVANSLQIIK